MSLRHAPWTGRVLTLSPTTNQAVPAAGSCLYSLVHYFRVRRTTYLLSFLADCASRPRMAKQDSGLDHHEDIMLQLRASATNAVHEAAAHKTPRTRLASPLPPCTGARHAPAGTARTAMRSASGDAGALDCIYALRAGWQQAEPASQLRLAHTHRTRLAATPAHGR